MPRSNVRIRPAGPADLDVLTALAAEYRDSIGRTYRLARPAADARGRYERLLADSAHRVVVAVDERTAEVVGMAVFGVDVVSTLADVPSIYVSNLLVAPQHRHRGAGRALLAAAVSYADELGLDYVIAGVATGGREANRFLARLGFAPLVLRRIAPVSALRRTLGLIDALGDVRHLPRRRALPPAARAARLRRLP
jgi:ribosomal protein S18 acetylase RimI-like enzyme